ncbi:MAG: hypothetical protein ACXVPU_09570 [Bacteroidia bacterium]
MNYQLQLKKEHSRSNTDKIAKAIGNDPIEFKKIVDILYKEEAPLPQRAAWLLVVVNDKYPELLKPYLKLFIDTVQNFKVPAVKRGMLQVLSLHKIPEKQQGKLLNICFDYVLSSDEALAVKVFSLQCIGNIAKEHPEIIPELKAAIEDQLPKTTAGFHARARLVLKALK